MCAVFGVKLGLSGRRPNTKDQLMAKLTDRVHQCMMQQEAVMNTIALWHMTSPRWRLTLIVWPIGQSTWRKLQAWRKLPVLHHEPAARCLGQRAHGAMSRPTSAGEGNDGAREKRVTM